MDAFTEYNDQKAKRLERKLLIIMLSAWMIVICSCAVVLWICTHSRHIPLNTGTVLLTISYVGLWALLTYTFCLLVKPR